MAGFCPSGKIRHDDRSKAYEHLATLKRTKGTRDRDDMQVYRCPECEGWHVGHRIGSRRRNRKVK